MVVLRKPAAANGDFGGTKLSLLLEKQHNRGQDGAGAAILNADPEPGASPYWMFKSASNSSLADVLGAIAKRDVRRERIFLGHLRYATFGKSEVAFCHPFVHESSDLGHTLLLAGNFNLTNAHELFDDYARHGSFPTSKADGYLICELIAKELAAGNIASAISRALSKADGAWTLCGMTGDGWAFATRDPNGIRPGYYYVDENVVAVASERPAIQAAFDIAPGEVKELPHGEVLSVSPDGKVECRRCGNVANANRQCHLEIGSIATGDIGGNGNIAPRPCSFERIYFSRANDADIHRERKALGAALLPRILKAADAPLEDIFFSYIPNSARIAFHGLLEALINAAFHHNGNRTSDFGRQTSVTEAGSRKSEVLNTFPRFGEVIVKDAKFRTFIADAAARREFYKHVYDVTYGLVRPGLDTLVVLDDSIVRGSTMKNAILPMLDRLGPKRIVIASSAPPVRYPDCYGIDMSIMGELVAFKALVDLLGENAKTELRKALETNPSCPSNPLAALYARFTDEEHCAEIARLLTPPGMKAEVKVVYQSVEDLRKCLTSDAGRRTSGIGVLDKAPEVSSLKSGVASSPIGDWYFTGDYPTPGGCKILRRAIQNHLEHKTERPY